MESDCNVELNKRLENINKIKDFLNDVDNRLRSIVGELNWDYEELCNEKNDTVLCSINPKHKLLKSSVESHEERCRWLKEGYHLDDKVFPEFSDNGYCTAITPELQAEIIAVAASKTDKFELGNKNEIRGIPQTSNRLEQDFSRDERLAIYDYVVANTQKKGSFSDFTFLSPEEKKEKKREMEQWEIAAAERDAKRRRASYRNKVHTNKKTHTEILREVIESQMECLKEELLPKTSQKFEREERLPKASSQRPEWEEERKFKKHDDPSSYKNSDRYDNGHKHSHRHKKSHHHHDRHHKKSHKRRDRSSSRSRNKKHKKSVSRSRSREKHRKSSSKPYE